MAIKDQYGLRTQEVCAEDVKFVPLRALCVPRVAVDGVTASTGSILISFFPCSSFYSSRT